MCTRASSADSAQWLFTARNIDCPPLPNCELPRMLAADATVAQFLCEGAVLTVRKPVTCFDEADWAMNARPAAAANRGKPPPPLWMRK